jgi:hypothetical protein
MFSLRKKGVEGLEQDELSELKSELEYIEKAKSDMDRNPRKAVSKQQIHDRSLTEVTTIVQNWRARTALTPSSDEQVLTKRGTRVSSDPIARHALRRLHEHLTSRTDPLAVTDGTAWTATLEELVTKFTCQLEITTIGDSEVPIWQPSVVEPHAFEGEYQIWQIYRRS